VVDIEFEKGAEERNSDMHCLVFDHRAVEGSIAVADAVKTCFPIATCHCRMV
jgi:hypothetical protein